MRTSRQNTRRWTGVVLGAAVVLGAVWLAGVVWPLVQPPAPGTLQRAEASPALPEIPVAATEEVIVLTMPPEGEAIALPTTLPGQIVVVGYPTPTPWPTFTPVPTPTSHPSFKVGEPLALPVPESPAGRILFRSPEDGTFLNSSSTNRYDTVFIDAEGKAVGEAPLSPDPQINEMLNSLHFVLPSPSGRYVAFSGFGMYGGTAYVLDRELNKMNPLFAHPEQYDVYGIGSYEQLPSRPLVWHPDDQHVLMWVAGSAYPGLWLVNVETGEHLVVKEVAGFPQGATISPDGQQIAYTAGTDPSSGDLYLEIASIVGVVEKQWTHINVSYISGGWSPDGKWIALIGSPIDDVAFKESQVLWLVNTESGETQLIDAPYVPYVAYTPKWSPTGRYLVLEGQTSDQPFRCYKKDLPPEEADSCVYADMGLYLFDIEMGLAELIVKDGISPVWSPDGNWLAFLSMRTGTPEIWLKNLADGEEQQITADGRWKWTGLIWLPANNEGLEQ